MKNLILFALLTLSLPGCGYLVRSPHATNTEDEKLSEDRETIEVYNEKKEPEQNTGNSDSDDADDDETPATGSSDGHIDFKDPSDFARSPQQIQSQPKAWPKPPATNPKIDAAQKLFAQALHEQNDGAFQAASDRWRQFLDRYPGMPGYEQAQFNAALTLLHLDRAGEAKEPLHSLIQTTGNPSFAIDARLLLAEALLRNGENEEALALTFDVLPEQRLEKARGLERASKATGVSDAGGKPNLEQRIKFYILRGRIFAGLKNQREASAALTLGEKLLEGPAKDQLSAKEIKLLRGTLSWRKVEVLEQLCRHQVTIPEALSEAEFLAYADAYYSCIAPARQLFCNVKASNDQQIESQALRTYRRLAEQPLEIRDHLPPPAREVRKKEQRGPYESEMKTLIEKTVQERSHAFRNIESCKAFDVF